MSNIDVITAFVVEEFLPGSAPADLPADYDLLATGVVDSLGLLKVIAWLEDRFELAIDDLELEPDSFRSVSAIDAFVTRAGQPAGIN
ncbi:phosphopantetheine-binding protein [Actinophytocola sp.]|uniref:phosphopantetheine-binding protein n=1 Tax=Actinophytocola sp. TaxID=1872138 RepID=UPI002ED30D18